RALGVEPLGEVFTADSLSGILRSSRQAVKAVLMDQRRIAGIGNIYATEALWRAGIDPSRAADRVAASRDDVEALHAAVQDVLRESIALRGTTFRDYQDAYGGKGGFAARLSAYGRDGEPCPRCGRRLIGTDAIDGRMTVFCAGCQT
ncbi:MAG: zinc finger domain-containing protein, partial [Gemmatimonadaceae bacterium]|nr:zinc finger domain-containing protein [Gemmatimonadaceae bacterium]